MKIIIRSPFCLILAFALLLLSSVSHGQEMLTNGPVKIIVPFTAGGLTDLVARTYGKIISDVTQSPVIVENRAGGAATIGTNYVAKSKPNGKTLLLGTIVTHAINPHLLNSVPYNALEDFIPIAMLGLNGNVLIVNAQTPVSNFAQFLDHVKNKKGKANYSSSSIGSTAHLAAEMLKSQVPGLDYTHIPYNGPTEALSALLGNQVDFMFLNVGSALPQIRAGKVKAIAVTTKDRLSQFHDVPTVAELLSSNFEVVGWFALYAPKGTDPALVQRLNVALGHSATSSEVAKTMESASILPISFSPEKTLEYGRSEFSKWGKVIDTARIPKM
jgi:tripartite-type tricarboxylate transporter receptor subunit TctC